MRCKFLLIDTPLNFWLSIIIQLIVFYGLLVYWEIITLNKKKFTYSVVFLFVPSIIISYFSSFIALIYYILGLFILILLENKKIINLFHLLMSIVIGILIDHFATLITYNIIPALATTTWYIIARMSIFLLLTIIFAFLYKKIISIVQRLSGATNKFVALILVILSIIILVFMYINIINSKKNEQSFLVIQNNLFLFLIFFVVFVTLVILIMYLAIKQIRISQKEIEMENFKIYVQSLENINSDMRKFKHDYLNILTSMRSFIDSKDYIGLEAYFYQHILKTEKEVFANATAFASLNNLNDNSIKGILTTKILLAQSLNIPFNVEIIDKISNINMDVIQLNRILGILIDNAIEASEEIEDAQIRLAFINFEDSLVIVLTNKFNNDKDLKVHKIFESGFSTKSDNRGIGLNTLRNIVRNNPDLNLSTKINGDLFVQELEIKGD